HAIFCGSEIIRPGTTVWQTLGLTEDSRWYDRKAGGVPGLGLDLADTFFLIADDISLGMYRFDAATRSFRDDASDGRNAREAIQEWIRQGQVDAYHGFLHYTRDQVLPLLERFYDWCDREGVPRLSTWVNHAFGACPSGLCPWSLRPNSAVTLIRRLARFTIGPLVGRKRYPMDWRNLWYQGARPGSPFYVNDVLRANGLKYIWLEADHDELPNVVALPEFTHGGRPSILEPVTMDDGSRYYRFRRNYGKVDAPRGVTVALRTSKVAFDSSRLFTAENLERLCRVQGTCILFTHWTVARSLPIQDETIGNFMRLKEFRDSGRIWVTRLSRLLEWTRLRTFVRTSSSLEGGRLVIEVGDLEDPVFGTARLEARDCRGLAFDIPPETGAVEVRIGGRTLPPSSVLRQGAVCWIGPSA
ncbi:MAG TPA: hypothetical protein VLN41_02265, partial [Candidatus Bathyarchaeia archaeon]|nr:hypothetical protein [Candidatus Bathyarchaeia archaeon]